MARKARKDCKHFDPDYFMEINENLSKDRRGRPYECNRPTIKTPDYVWGGEPIIEERLGMPAQEERVDESGCGPEGKYWQARG